MILCFSGTGAFVFSPPLQSFYSKNRAHIFVKLICVGKKIWRKKLSPPRNRFFLQKSAWEIKDHFFCLISPFYNMGLRKSRIHTLTWPPPLLQEHILSESKLTVMLNLYQVNCIFLKQIGSMFVFSYYIKDRPLCVCYFAGHDLFFIVRYFFLILGIFSERDWSAHELQLVPYYFLFIALYILLNLDLIVKIVTLNKYVW